MNTIADRIIEFNHTLSFNSALPEGIRVMNPFKENKDALSASSAFYKKYYSDNEPRYMILGINPGRFGAGLTGVPFTDPKRLRDNCHISSYTGPLAHEPSSVFIYELIKRYGGEEKFYRKFYINSICPLGFTSTLKSKKEVNYNYYDSPELIQATTAFILQTLNKQLEFNIQRGVCFCLGCGKNKQFISKLNKQHQIFNQIVPLEHPRYIIQYKNKQTAEYANKYISLFAQFAGD